MSKVKNMTNKGHVLLGLILGLIVAVFAALVAFMFMNKNESPVNEHAKDQQNAYLEQNQSAISSDPNKSLYSQVPLDNADKKIPYDDTKKNIENSDPKANKSSEEAMQEIIKNGGVATAAHEQKTKKKKKELPEYIDEFGEKKIGTPTENALHVNNRTPEEKVVKPKEINPNEADPIKGLITDTIPNEKSAEHNKKDKNKKEDVVKTKQEKNGVFFVQVGSFKSDEQADRQKATLLMQGLQANVVEAEREGSVVHRVRLGPFYSKKETEDIEKKLYREAIPYKVIKTEE
jgi:cell division protein FtsN